jgi:hypothetical protein
VLLHQLGDDLILAAELLPSGGDGPLVLGLGGAVFSLERGGAVLEELPLPGVEGGKLELVLVAEVGDGGLLDQVTAEDSNLLRRMLLPQPQEFLALSTGPDRLKPRP